MNMGDAEKGRIVVLLNKAIQAGQISLIEYFVGCDDSITKAVPNYLQLQNQYQKVMAQLYKYRL